MNTQVPIEKAELALKDFLTEQLCEWPEWMKAVCERVRENLLRSSVAFPARVEEGRRKLGDIQKRIDNLVLAISDGLGESKALKTQLLILEREQGELLEQHERLTNETKQEIRIPDDETVADLICEWAHSSVDDPAILAGVFRSAVVPVRVYPVISPGKQRGYPRLVFRVNGWGVLQSAFRDEVNEVTETEKTVDQMSSPEFTLDLGKPTEMDRWAEQIVAWRNEGVKWEEIVERTGMDLNRVCIADKRYREAMKTTQSEG